MIQGHMALLFVLFFGCENLPESNGDTLTRLRISQSGQILPFSQTPTT